MKLPCFQYQMKVVPEVYLLLLSSLSCLVTMSSPPEFYFISDMSPEELFDSLVSFFFSRMVALPKLKPSKYY